jgi:hypothetical protein
VVHFGEAMLPNENSMLTPVNDTCSIQSLFSAVSLLQLQFPNKANKTFLLGNARK